MAHAGDVIADRFVVEREVASGGMGRIFLALDRQTDQLVAVKLVVDTRPKGVKRLLHEAAVLSQIRHPGIVRHIAHGQIDEQSAYLVMEWLDGVDLDHHLRGKRTDETHGTDTRNARTAGLWEETQDTVTITASSASNDATCSHRIRAHLVTQTLSIEHVIKLGRRLSAAVAELHRQHMIHRDIKPANLFLPNQSLEQVKLIDFGTVFHYDRGKGVREPGRLLGTPHYMAPEQARVTGALSPATDVWAMGCVLYQCLTGIRPFSGRDMLAILTCIVVDEPVPVNELRPDVPDELAELVMETLAKPPRQRPADGSVLADRLRRLDSRARPRRTRRDDTRSQPVLTDEESRVTCVLFVDESQRWDDEPSISNEDIQGTVRSYGSDMQQLADGTRLVTVSDTDAPTAQAGRAARVALKLRAAYPFLSMLLVTGRVTGYGRGVASLASVMASTSLTLRKTERGVISLDSMTASLLETRFHLRAEPGGIQLQAERPRDATRTVLGKPVRMVGRDEQLEELRGAMQACVRESQARAILVTGAPGIGKSRLLEEFVRQLDTTSVTCLQASADTVSAGSPFLLLIPMLRQLIGIVEGESIETQRDKLRRRISEVIRADDVPRVATFIGELVGIPEPYGGSDALSAARDDPALRGQLMLQAWEDWTMAESRRRPLLFLFDDLHLGDLPSVQYIDRMLMALAHQRVLVVALARLEVHSAFPALWRAHAIRSLELPALTPEASLDICRQVVDDRPPASLVNHIVGLADGNALYLEELLRTLEHEEKRDRSETLIGIIQARLDALGPQAKRVLRAASIFGRTFWQGGVEALLGDTGAFKVAEWLDELVRGESIERRSMARMPGEIEYEFRNDLVREGAYATLTDEDRTLGHGLAAKWLLRSGENNPLVLAEHLACGGAHTDAVPFFLDAARLALEGNDMRAAIARAARGIDIGADGEHLGRLCAVQSAAHYGLGEDEASERIGRQALERLPDGDAGWFDVVATVMVCCYRLGRPDSGDELLERASTTPARAGADIEQAIALCRGSMQLILSGRGARAEPTLERVSAMLEPHPSVGGRGDYRALAQLYSARGMLGMFTDHWENVVEYMRRAGDAFEAVGDVANALNARIGETYGLAEIGCFERALERGRRVMVVAERIGATPALRLCRVDMGYILTHIEGGADEARRLLKRAADEYRACKNPRMHGFALSRLAILCLKQGRAAQSEVYARQALEVLGPVVSGHRPWAFAVHAVTLLENRRPEPALTLARKAMAELEQIGAVTHGTGLPPLALARALHANGREKEARQAIADANVRMLARAERLTDPVFKRCFLAKDVSREIGQLADAWLETLDEP